MISEYLKQFLQFGEDRKMLEDNQIQYGLYLLIEQGMKTREEISEELRKYDIFLKPPTILRIILGKNSIHEFESESDYRQFIMETRQIQRDLSLIERK